MSQSASSKYSAAILAIVTIKNSYTTDDLPAPFQRGGIHTPVMLREALEALKAKPGDLILDCTVGCGGHAEAIIQRIGPGGTLVGIDKDTESLAIAKDRLSNFEAAFIPIYGDFRNLKNLLREKKIEREPDGVLFDLGISSKQLDEAERGFSFSQPGRLDMRMDRAHGPDAALLVNRLSESELDDIIYRFGEERFHRRIARAIVRSRRDGRIETTARLADVIARAVPRRGYRKIHPATRTFQALRIAVNAEMDALREALDDAVPLLAGGGRICVISFHSLEDRIVKRMFKEFQKQEMLDIITKRPLRPAMLEVSENRRARSAKMRIGERR